MAITEFNLQQKALANKPYIETYGIDLLNKISHFYIKLILKTYPMIKIR